MNDHLDQLLKSLCNKGLKSIDLSLDRIHKFLHKIGNPQNQLNNIIHVAGTNGKGSVIAFVKTILRESGYSVNVYTSPHLLKFNERIELNGEYIKDEYLINLLTDIKKLNSEIPLTYFESVTVAAFLAFAQNPADFNILEVGLGGRLDATNVIKNSLYSLITPISYDHTEYLGNAIEKIAHEKASIIKPNSKVIIAKQPGNILQIIIEYAVEKNNKIISYGKDYLVKDFLYNGDLEIDLSMISLCGEHQKYNAASAIKLCEELQIGKSDIISGLQSTSWRGRLEKILTTDFNSFDEVFVDCAHNPAGAETLSDWLIKEKSQSKLPISVYCISGMLKDKDYKEFYSKLSPHIKEFFITIGSEKKYFYHPEKIMSFLETIHDDAKVAESILTALQTIDDIREDSRKLIIICGSIYLIGDAIKLFHSINPDMIKIK